MNLVSPSPMIQIFYKTKQNKTPKQLIIFINRGKGQLRLTADFTENGLEVLAGNTVRTRAQIYHTIHLTGTSLLWIVFLERFFVCCLPREKECAGHKQEYLLLQYFSIYSSVNILF